MLELQCCVVFFNGLRLVDFCRIGKMHRNTVYGHAEWNRHKSSWRHGRHLSSIASSGVIFTLAPPVLACTFVAVFVSVFNYCVQEELLPSGCHCCMWHRCPSHWRRLYLPSSSSSAPTPPTAVLMRLARYGGPTWTAPGIWPDKRWHGFTTMPPSSNASYATSKHTRFASRTTWPRTRIVFFARRWARSLSRASWRMSWAPSIVQITSSKSCRKWSHIVN